MLRYVLIILLVNYYNYGLGNPIPTNHTTIDNSVKLVKALVDLAKSCNNSFVIKQIKLQIETCNIKVPLYDDQSLKCMLFYDINSRLCADDRFKNLPLDGDDISGEKVNVIDICRNALTWNFTALPEFENYKNYSELKFRNISSCTNICMMSEYMKDDSSFFCKYYNWASMTYDSMSNKNSTPKLEAPELNVQNDVEYGKHPMRVFGGEDASVKTKPDNTTVNSKVTEQENLTIQAAQSSGGLADLENLAINDTQKNKDSGVIVSPETAQNKNKNVISEMVPETPTGQGGELSTKDGPNAEVAPSLEEQKIVNIPDKGKPKEIVESPKLKVLPNDTYDDIDSDNDVGAEDTQVQDEDDSVNIDLDEQLNKPFKSKSINIEPPVLDNKHIDMFPDAIQEGFPEEDEDHFFTFFLSAVVLIIILYVLYHNKSKVSKVILGLIVEGRQSGRRRNSRGHSYKRLDTLEQAISTNPTAAPTKIIY